MVENAALFGAVVTTYQSNQEEEKIEKRKLRRSRGESKEELARSSNGRTPGFGPGYWGSSPCRAASMEKTPGSDLIKFRVSQYI